MTRTFSLVLAGCLLIPLCGCDPLVAANDAHSWHPTGIYDANLAAMADNPADLVHGRGLRGSNGVAATAAIDRLRHDTVKPLPDANGGDKAGPGAATGPAAN
jgi:type IV pilus biogenesis protein CpaD/CtpE